MNAIAKPRVEFEPVKPLIGSVVRAERAALFDPEVVRRCREMLDGRAVLSPHVDQAVGTGDYDPPGSRAIVGVRGGGVTPHRV